MPRVGTRSKMCSWSDATTLIEFANWRSPGNWGSANTVRGYVRDRARLVQAADKKFVLRQMTHCGKGPTFAATLTRLRTTSEIRRTHPGIGITTRTAVGKVTKATGNTAHTTYVH